MHTKHLGAGSKDPPRTEGLLRVYSNVFCPYAQRVLLVLNAKHIPHEVVNINLFEKPEWYTGISNTGLVPCLIDGPKTVIESLDICDYLDEKYPERPLYPSDPEAKKRDQDIIKKADPAQRIFSQILKSKGSSTSPEEWAKLMLEAIQYLETELSQRGTPFFGGDSPGMVDYMIWPWPERDECLTLKLGQKLPIKEPDIPVLRKWRRSMLIQPLCQKLYIDGERFWKIYEASKILHIMPQFDDI